MNYDAIVLGAGAVGSAAMAELARRGLRVLGIDRFAPPHDRGSSHGRSRFIRQAYFEHPHYVPLATRAFQNWAELEAATATTLYRQTGLLQVGPVGGGVVAGVLASARQHHLPIDMLDAADVAARFPAFRVPEECAAVFEHRAGILRVEACVAAQLELARRHGAELHTGEAVVGWKTEGSTITVQTDRGTYHAARLVVTAGAWAGQVLDDLGIRFEVRRKPQFWFAADLRYQADGGCPGHLFETPAGVFYGFPQVDETGVKVAEHTGGQLVADPAAVDRALDPVDLETVRQFLTAHLPGVDPRPLDHSVCLYTMSPDEHFIVDRHPDCQQVVFAAGLSGHGFKFAPVLGEALADLAMAGQSDLPIGFLSLQRQSLT